MTEPELIKRLIAKDNSAFEELVDGYSSKVFNTCLNIVQSREDAEDLSQEVFIEIYRSVSGFRSESKLSTWVYRIAVTKSLEHLRRMNGKKRFAYFQNLFTQEKEDGVSTDFHHPGVLLENKEMTAILFAAIHKLPERQKAAFILNKIEHLSYQEIAEVLNVSVSTVESLLFRAKQGLQKLLGNYYEKNFK